MKELNLYKFITSNSIEYHWHERNGEKDVIFFINFNQIEDFAKMLDPFDYDDEGISVVMKDGYFCFWASDIPAFEDMNLESVFEVEV